MLEQITYEVPRALERKQIVYQIGDLESLSATALYYGDGSSSGSSSGSGGGFGGFGIIESAYEKGKKKGPSSGAPVPRSIGSISDFKPASNFGIGPGIAREVESFLERYRAGKHEKSGEDHVNLEYFSPIDILGPNKKKKPLLNTHIDMKDD